MAHALDDRLFQAAFFATLDSLLISDAAGKIVLCNPAAHALFGYGPDELTGLPLERLVPGRFHIGQDPGGHVRSPGALQLKEGRALQGLRKDGSVFSAEMHLSPLGDGSVLSTVRDVSESRHTEEALRKFSRVVEQTASAVLVTDAQGTIEYVNPRFAAISGYTAAELIGKRPSVLKSGHTSAREYAKLWHTITRGDVWQGEFRNRRKDGSLYWESAIISPVRDEDGRITHFVGIKDDITERKKAESSLQALQAEVEQLLSHHVASQTVSAIAHELNQPLNAITSYAEAALRLLRAGNPQPERLRHALEGSAQQAQRAGQVIRELLIFLHKGEVPTETVDLNDVVCKTAARINADGSKAVRPRLNLDPTLPPVMANQLQIEKVLNNLISNGIEAMADAGVDTQLVTIAVGTGTSGNQAQVTVSDTGPGIEPEMLQHIFDPFFTTKPTGLGMGLAISRAIIEAHGGQLWVETDSGEGATFHFTLPFAT